MILNRAFKRAWKPLRQQLRWWGVLSIGAAAWSLPATLPAWAEQSVVVLPECAPREELLGRLASQLDEHLAVSLVNSSGMLIEITASTLGGWTVLVTPPGGGTCLEDFGEGFRVWQPTSERS